LTSSHWDPSDTAPTILLQGLDSRRDQCKEMASFVKDILNLQFKDPNDLVFITGDFNISKFDLP
jgi:hypothetical protein